MHYSLTWWKFICSRMGDKINELTFYDVLASLSWWCSWNPGGRDPSTAIDRNKYYLRRRHCAKFQPHMLSDKLHDVKITFSLYKTTLTLSFIPALKSKPVIRKWRLSHHLNSFTPSVSLPPDNKCHQASHNCVLWEHHIINHGKSQWSKNKLDGGLFCSHKRSSFASW
jgi:hypothetical protein